MKSGGRKVIPFRTGTMSTPQVARRILDVHKELASLIEIRDAAGARRLMDDHVKMIGARRVAEHRHKDGAFSGKVDTGFPQKMRPTEESNVEQDCC